jgi:hypothetical protein
MNKRITTGLEIKDLEIKGVTFDHTPSTILVFLPCALGTSLFLHLPFGRFASVSSFIGFSVDISLLDAIQLVISIVFDLNRID